VCCGRAAKIFAEEIQSADKSAHSKDGRLGLWLCHADARQVYDLPEEVSKSSGSETRKKMKGR
jgi:hypothetical protein